jgi:hypothetical protein
MVGIYRVSSRMDNLSFPIAALREQAQFTRLLNPDERR